MAKYIPGSGGIMVGKLGGVVYSKNKGGYYAKIFVPPSNPRSDRQIEQRAALSVASNTWKALTANQRTAWNTAAIASGVWTTGKSMYVALYSNILLAAEAPALPFLPLSDVPGAPVNNNPVTIAATASTMTIDLTAKYTGDVVPADTSVVIKMRAPLTGGTTKNGTSLWSVITVLQTGADTSAAINVFAAYTSRWGTIAAGDGIVAMFDHVNINSGLKVSNYVGEGVVA